MEQLSQLKLMLHKKWAQSILLSGFFTLMVWAVMATSVRKGLPFLDAGLFEYFGFAMSKGDVPYLNIFDHKGPVIFLVNYIGYALAGPFGIKCLYLLCIFIFFNICYAIGRLFASVTSIFFVDTIIYFVLIVYFDGGWGLEGYMLPFIAFSLFVFIKYLLHEQLENRDIVLVGFSFAVVLLTKANMIGLWIVFSLYLLMEFIYKKAYKRLLEVVLYFVGGALVFALPVFIYLGVTGSFSQMLFQSISLNIIYSKEASDITVGKMLEWYFTLSNSFYLNLMMILATAIFAKKKKTVLWVLNITFLWCLYLTLISRRQYLHYFIVLLPFYVPYIAVVLGEAEKYFTSKKILLFSTLICFLFFNSFKTVGDKWSHRYDDQAIAEQYVGQYLQEKTKPDERIYAHNSGGIVYLDADRLSSTRFFFIPALTDVKPIYQLFVDSFEKSLPKYIVYRKNSEIKNEIDQYVKNEIDQKYQLDNTIGVFELYRLK
ncbi:MAG: hypothetical protein E6334_06105 [Streptococcus peroris]|nr:hypothetical protein [Streptococcus peroris]